MKLDKAQAKQKVIDTILGERHPFYERTEKLAKLYKMLNTGENIESILERYNPRESEQAFEQRKRITQATTPAMISSVRRPFLKVPRTDRVVRRIIPKNKKRDKHVEVEIEEKLSLFYGSDSEEGGLDFWLRNRFVELSFQDPNAFIVIEFDDFDHLQEQPNAYPFEVYSKNALNYDIQNNNTNWLVADKDIKYKHSKKGDKYVFEEGKTYTIYCGEFSIVFRRVSSNKQIRLSDLQENETVIEAKSGEFYAISEYDTLLPDWQLFRVGYVRDELTNGQTFVSPYHSAMPYLIKSIKAVSEMDLTNVLHVFPQKYSYVRKCQGIEDKPCLSGYTRGGEVCKACNGKGILTHTSSQDIITLPLPEDKESMIPMRDMMAYFSPPIELLEFQYKVINDFEPKVHQAIFNSTVLVQKTIVATATEKEQDMESVYDTLTPFAQKCSAVYLNVCNAVAVLLGYEEKVSFVYRYPSDFKIKSRKMLYDEMKTINESNAPSFVRESIQDDFASQVYIDDPEGMVKYNTKKKFTPFRGKSEEEIMIALNSPLTLQRTKILYLNFEEVFTEAEQSEANFYILEYSKQKEIIDSIIKDLTEKLSASDPSFDPIKTEEETE